MVVVVSGRFQLTVKMSSRCGRRRDLWCLCLPELYVEMLQAVWKWTRLHFSLTIFSLTNTPLNQIFL